MSEAKTAIGERRITIKDVAARAGVGFPSVSTVLNGGGSRHVAEDTRQRILMAAQELGYRPNLAAQSMRSRRSMQVGVLLRNNSRVESSETLAHPLAWEIVLGISEGLEAAGYMMSLVRLSDVDPRKHPQASVFQGHLLDGLIVVSDVPAVSPERLQDLVPHCVWVDGPVWNPTGCLRRDEEGAGATTAHAVLDAGYREVVCLVPREDGGHYSGAQRMRGIRRVLGEGGARLRELDAADGEGPVLDELPALLRKDVALLVPNSYMTYVLMRYFMARRLVPGEDFGLACCEDGLHGNGVEWSELARVSFNRFDMGQTAARQLIAHLETGTSESRLLRGSWREGKTLPPCP